MKQDKKSLKGHDVTSSWLDDSSMSLTPVYIAGLDKPVGTLSVAPVVVGVRLQLYGGLVHVLNQQARASLVNFKAGMVDIQRNRCWETEASYEELCTLEEFQGFMGQVLVVEKPTTIEMWNPFDAVIDAALKLYPSLDCLVEWEEGDAVSKPGSTLFPDDGSLPIVRINVGIPVSGAIEVLAHELAHVVVGPDCDDAHGPEWQEVFDKIHEQYLKDNGGEKDV